MNLKTVLIILVTVFYTLGLAAELNECPLFFGGICLFILLVFNFSKFLEPKHLFILFLMFCAGFYNMKFQTKDFDELSSLNANNVILMGRAESISQISRQGSRAKFYLKAQEANIYGKKFKPADSRVLITINDSNKAFDKIQIGDIISIKGNLRTPKAASNPSQFDYAKYLKYKDTFSILYVEGENFDVLDKADSFKEIRSLEELWWFLLQGLDNTRNTVIAKHGRQIKSPQLEILGGIVFGNEAINPPDEVKQSFINSGLLHILAASGLNVALIFGIWWFLAQNLRLPYALSIYGGMFFIILYTFMTGFPPSILRASVMILFVLFGKLIDRSSNPIALIFFVGLIMLIFDPKMFTDVGFQLSFIVTIGLIVTVEPVASLTNDVNKKFLDKFKKQSKIISTPASFVSPKTIVATILIPLCAQLYVAPLQMYYFNTFTPWSFFANMCVVPFVGIISFLGFISSIFSTIPYMGDKVVIIFDILVNPFLVLLVKISHFFSHLKYSILTMPSPSAIQMILYWGILVLLVENIVRKFKNKKFKIALVTLLLVFLCTFIKFENKDLEIISFDVGNADSFLIKTPKNKYIMIDTARAPYRGVSSAKMIMEEYLKDKNIRELEILVITHFDADHCGGAVDILNDFKVKKVIVQSLNPDENKGKEIIKLLSERKINYSAAKNNDTVYTEKDFKIKTFVPNINNYGTNKDKFDNETSVVALVDSKDAKALFMADCGLMGYESIKKYLPKIDILKVGHHGAKGVLSKNMLEALNPRHAIISTGYNVYGHPSVETTKLLREEKIQTYITRDPGAIKISACKSNHIGRGAHGAQRAQCKIEYFEGRFKITNPKTLPDEFDKSHFALKLIKEPH